MIDLNRIEKRSNEQVAVWVHERLSAALRRSSDPVAITVPGGSTPFPILGALAQLPLDWPRVVVWPGDDRSVPERHPSSNTGRIRAILAPTGAQIVTLRPRTHPPHFALTWLGLGADGHVASLFPDSNPTPYDPEPVRRFIPEPLPPEAPYNRISLTMSALLRADEFLFVFRKERQPIFDAAVRGDNDLPISRLLSAARQPITCFS